MRRVRKSLTESEAWVKVSQKKWSPIAPEKTGLMKVRRYMSLYSGQQDFLLRKSYMENMLEN